ncbi:serine hydrolase [Streptomyces sp. WMMB 322]|uniref:serine hydrolase domain-containing protein n=1 Tax=Streptomyces sp. WMMB 322 TaxID=1286821 RepID=UPI0009459EB9|nr:serine hydrolase domain-containing protein [Streptomyces sp. WMMB 322]
MLGRLVEVLLGKPYDACLRERLLTPLGLSHAATGPYEAIMFRAAVGHVASEPGAPCEPAPVWALARSNAPAGSTLAMSVRDLLAFARMHLEDGRAGDGRRVLAPGTAARMHAREVGLPDLGLRGTSWGLGFERYDTGTGAIIGHDGSTIGQDAFLRMVPEAGVAVAVLTNGGDAHSLHRDIVAHVLGALTSAALPELPTPPPNPERIDAGRYVGTYSAQAKTAIPGCSHSPAARTRQIRLASRRSWAARCRRGTPVFSTSAASSALCCAATSPSTSTPFPTATSAPCRGSPSPSAPVTRCSAPSGRP